MMTATELAVRMWGKSENHSRSSGARGIRQVLRELYPDEAPGQGRQWQITERMALAVRRRLG
jgi:hypothetical protein